MAPNNMSACLPLPPEARAWRAPQQKPGGRLSTHSTSAMVWIRLCRSWQRGDQSLAAAKLEQLDPEMSEPGVPGFVGSVRTRLQRSCSQGSGPPGMQSLTDSVWVSRSFPTLATSVSQTVGFWVQHSRCPVEPSSYGVGVHSVAEPPCHIDVPSTLLQVGRR